MEEYRDTGWNGVSCTKDGKFMRNGKPIKVRNPRHRHSATIVACVGEGKKQEINAKWLVARAWCPDYVEGCHVIQKDEDKNNVSVENLLIVGKKEFRKYQAMKSAKSRWGTTVDKDDEVFKPTFIPGVECTISGVFKKNGRRIKLQERQDILGRTKTVKFYAYVDGVRRTFTAARVVAQTWSPSVWDDGCIIQYKDGNSRNIHSDNLVLVNANDYLKGKGQYLGKKNKTEFEEAYRYVERAAKEAGIAYRYFQTGDFTELNEYVKTELFQSVYNHAGKYFSGREMVNELTTEVVGIMYEHVFANRPLFCYFNFCKRLIMIYYRQRDFGYYRRLPNPIVRKNVSQLNLESLCERFREMKIK